MTRFVAPTLSGGYSSIAQLQNALDEIQTALDSMVSREGDAPNFMSSDFDLNSNDLLNGGSASFNSITLGGVSITATVGSVNEAGNYTWTGTHNFTSATVNGLDAKNFTWTGTHDFTGATVTGAVDTSANYAWTGTHDFTGATVTGSVDTSANYTWTGTHTFTGATVNGLTASSFTDFDAAVQGVEVALNNQTGTTYTLVLTDAQKLVTLSNASAITLTVPPNSSVAYPTGTVITLAQLGAGQVTITEGSGVTVNSENGLKLNAQYAQASIIKTDTDTWLASGSLTT